MTVQSTITRRPGETVPCHVYDVQFYDFAAKQYEAVSCQPAYPKLTITDVNGSVKVDAQTMSQVATNEYIYNYDLASDAAKGHWRCQAELRYTYGGHTYKEIETWTFEVI